VPDDFPRAVQQELSTAVAEMGDRGHNRHEPISRGAVPYFRGSWVPM